MIKQIKIDLEKRRRGFHLITNELIAALPELPKVGMLNVFLQHSSAGLTINENADPTVRDDFETVFNKMVPEYDADYKHVLEGEDDMPAHIKSSLVGTSLTIPITNGRLNLGIWQGIYLCEFRNNGGRRRLVLTIYY
ncbi:secondary thiamine-phosphate synthase enzyme YjbQ [Carboxylicivirga mesophila]|uniref:Secondary thiamine-phosphate synthase enzyme YjbQ n=1 Tax=Carboxylicivirga mesophila TaxID=1166478 RepID=A0ABS5K798_9BACT|nr:secondary thiamine-phosphate synthase enzyme YjbQ [Carboxylicivirga mesophila]